MTVQETLELIQDIYYCFIRYPWTRKRIYALQAALGAVIFLELFRAERFTHLRARYGIDEHLAQTAVYCYLDISDIIGAFLLYTIFLGALLGAIRFFALLLWTGTVWGASREYTLGRIRNTPGGLLYHRRRLFQRGKPYIQRFLGVLWLMVLVAWMSDQMHPDPPRRVVTPDNMGPWWLALPTLMLRDILNFVWKKLIVCVFLRTGNFTVPWQAQVELDRQWVWENWEDTGEWLEEIDRCREREIESESVSDCLPVHAAEKV
ncbi:hypothetical protein C8F04DRAFT_191157 [Mycena alexandri]|uniref:Uncharacterized protein n=1 Tax=Mycena alexandri TaxID=1745969 RepID=A0AAD6SBD1_9AGAR|nr:hypothetical protein C8F04DRAFT_191157 [Mycena alexandri]